jgi:hypothetical protein
MTSSVIEPATFRISIAPQSTTLPRALIKRWSIFKCISLKQGVTLWTGINWLTIRLLAGYCNLSASIQDRECPGQCNISISCTTLPITTKGFSRLRVTIYRVKLLFCVTLATSFICRHATSQYTYTHIYVLCNKL